MLPPPPSKKKKEGAYYRRAEYADRENLRGFAMAAVTLGAVLRPDPYLDRTYLENGKPIRQVFWFFESRMRDPRYNLAKLWDTWNDPEWRTANPTHELTTLWTFWDNLTRSAEHVAACPEKVMFKRGDNYLLMPKNVPAAIKERAFTALTDAAKKAKL